MERRLGSTTGRPLELDRARVYRYSGRRLFLNAAAAVQLACEPTRPVERRLEDLVICE